MVSNELPPDPVNPYRPSAETGEDPSSPEDKRLRALVWVTIAWVANDAFWHVVRLMRQD